MSRINVITTRILQNHSNVCFVRFIEGALFLDNYCFYWITVYLRYSETETLTDSFSQWCGPANSADSDLLENIAMHLVCINTGN